MKPLIVLLTVFILSLVIFRLFQKKTNFIAAGNIAMAAMLFFTSIGHFMYLEGMSEMLPDWIPGRKLIVLITGFIEIAAGVGLLVTRTRRIVGGLLILFFICIVPANIYAAIHHVDIETGARTGAGPGYLWFRIPLQIFFIAWVYWFSVRLRKG